MVTTFCDNFLRQLQNGRLSTYHDRRRKDPQPTGQSVLVGNAGEDFTGTKQGVIEMREATNKQEPSSKEGREVKVGDKVWVLCEVVKVYNRSLYMDIRHDGAVFEAKASDCRPVEPSVVKDSLTTEEIADTYERVKQIVAVTDDSGDEALYVDGVLKAWDSTIYACDIAAIAGDAVVTVCHTNAGRTLSAWPKKLSDVFASNDPEIPDSSSEPLQVGDAVVIVERSHKWRGVRGRIVSVSESNEYPLEFISDCGKRLGYFPSSSMRKIDQADPVNPSHYKQGGIECIEAIKAALCEGFPDYLRGNVMKYLWRYKEKGGVEDLRKSAWYLDRLFKEVGE